MRNPLIPEELLAALHANYHMARKVDEAADATHLFPPLKLFLPATACTWLIVEANPDDPDELFGLCDLGQGCPELGYVSMTELTSVRDPRLGLAVERDGSFEPKMSLGDYADEARARGSIIDWIQPGEAELSRRRLKRRS